MTRTKRKSKPARRDSSILAAKSRKSGGMMKHRLEPKGGAKNDQPELLSELDDIPTPMNEHEIKQYLHTINTEPEPKPSPRILDDNEEDDDFC